jgi:hypothetical protein
MLYEPGSNRWDRISQNFVLPETLQQLTTTAEETPFCSMNDLIRDSLSWATGVLHTEPTNNIVTMPWVRIWGDIPNIVSSHLEFLHTVIRILLPFFSETSDVGQDGRLFYTLFLLLSQLINILLIKALIRVCVTVS